MLKYEVTIKDKPKTGFMSVRKVIFYTRYGQYHRINGHAITDTAGEIYYNYSYGILTDDFSTLLKKWHTIHELI